MKLLLAHAARAAAAAKPPQTRALSGFREQAVRAVTSKLRSDLESNPNLWLSAGAVVRGHPTTVNCVKDRETKQPTEMTVCGRCQDEPTVSILDPASGYAIANGMTGNSHADFERCACSVMGRLKLVSSCSRVDS